MAQICVVFPKWHRVSMGPFFNSNCICCISIFDTWIARFWGDERRTADLSIASIPLREVALVEDEALRGSRLRERAPVGDGGR
jgi:hypothetical protein